MIIVFTFSYTLPPQNIRKQLPYYFWQKQKRLQTQYNSRLGPDKNVLENI